jgi:anti-sigma factor RsiW
VRTSRWTQACPGWRGDLAAYLVGALDPQACAAVRRHLGTCPACEAEYQDLAPVVSRLALLTRPALRQHAVTLSPPAWRARPESRADHGW